MGSKKTEKKAASSRENGKLGGRPNKNILYNNAVDQLISMIDAGECEPYLRHTTMYDYIKDEILDLRSIEEDFSWEKEREIIRIIKKEYKKEYGDSFNDAYPEIDIWLKSHKITDDIILESGLIRIKYAEVKTY